jgi:phage terminase large subunit GpA-like protein
MNAVGLDWLAEEADAITESIKHVSPSEFNEANRYLPASVSSMPGPIRFDVNPFMKEIIDCADVRSPVREVNVKKGVQITYSTLLESIFFYFMGHVKTDPCMYLTADKELASARIENNFLLMIQQSGFGHLIRSNDEGNSRKTGATKAHIQWAGGGVLYPFGAVNANKMRSFSIRLMMKDEIDAFPEVVGKDGDPDKLSDDRCAGYWDRRKIYRGSTPLLLESSKISKAFKRGDQREYMVLCKKCSHPQFLRWSGVNNDGKKYGFVWDYDNGKLIEESVRYLCDNCQEPHFEYDKRRLFATEHGAHWKPFATPAAEGIRSYHLPALYSPIGMQPWSKCVASYLEAYDPITKKVKDIGQYQVFYNNILAEAFETVGAKLTFGGVSAHKRAQYTKGVINNNFCREYLGGRVLFVTCQVDVHKSNLAVAVMGWTAGKRCYVIDYLRIEDDDCTVPESPAWDTLATIIEENNYTDTEDEYEYRINMTLIDSGYANSLVCSFCSQYESGVYPIVGADKPSRSSVLKEFSQFKTQVNTTGYRIIVDYYKDRLAPALRREWNLDAGVQPEGSVNMPVDMTDKELKELTAESKRRRTIDKTNVVEYFWYRPSGRDNELWDLLVYGFAAVDIMAWGLCVKHLEKDEVDWNWFWDYMENGR